MRKGLCFTALIFTGCKNPLVVKDYLNLVSLSPGQGATQVAVDTNVIAGFSEPLVASSVDSQTAYITDLEGTPVVAATVYETNAHWIVIDPEEVLAPNTTYVVTFTSSIQGEHAGNLLAPVQTQFTTAGTNPSNSLPVADAGPDLEVGAGQAVTLDGTASADPEGSPVTYQWRFVSVPATSSANLSTETGPETTFTTDSEGEYIVGLVVNDGEQDSSEDFVIIQALGEAPEDPAEDTGTGETADTGSEDTGDGSDTGT